MFKAKTLIEKGVLGTSTSYYAKRLFLNLNFSFLNRISLLLNQIATQLRIYIYIYIYTSESNGKLPHPFIPSKTSTLVPEFAMEDLPLGRIAPFVPEVAVNDLPLGRTLMIYM